MKQADGERPKPQNEPDRVKTIGGLEKGMMKARPDCRSDAGKGGAPSLWSLFSNSVACRSTEKRKSDFAAANFPFMEIGLSQRCDGVVKKKRAEGSGNAHGRISAA